MVSRPRESRPQDKDARQNQHRLADGEPHRRRIHMRAASGQQRQYRQQGNDGDVLKQQDGERGLASRRLRPASLLQDLHGEGRRRQR